MATNRAEARIKIREILRDFYDVDTVGTGGINATSTTLPVTNPSRYSVENFLQIASEILYVRERNLTNSQLTVARGAKGSTAAIHAAAVAIQIMHEYSDRAINQCVDIAVGDSYHPMRGGIWIETIDETLSTLTTSGVAGREYLIPAGLTHIPRIQVLDSSGHYQENRDWELIGTKIQFKRDFPSSGKTIRLIGTSYQALLTDDATDFTISDEQLQFIIYDAAWHAIQQRFAHRLRATEYAAAVNERAGQPFDLINMANNLRRTVEQLKEREFKGRMPEYATRPRR